MIDFCNRAVRTSGSITRKRSLDLVLRLCHSSSVWPGSIIMRSFRICGLQNDTGARLLRVRRFTQSIPIQRTAQY